MIITGIGSRIRPAWARDVALKVMSNLYTCSTLRSGAADGMDSDFEELAVSKEIYLPYKGFNNSESTLHLDNISPQLVKMANELIKSIHPAYNRLSRGGIKLHTRNVFQVLGLNLDRPSDLVICYTENGETKGGTATAINIANMFDVRVINFGSNKGMNELHDLGLLS